MAWNVLSRSPNPKGGDDIIIAECLAADDKDVLGVGDFSICTELDTKISYRFSNENENPETSDGWWPI